MLRFVCVSPYIFMFGCVCVCIYIGICVLKCVYVICHSIGIPTDLMLPLTNCCSFIDT